MKTKKFNFPYGQGKAGALSQEDNEKLEKMRALLTGISYQQATTIVDVLKEQLSEMCTVTIIE